MNIDPPISVYVPSHAGTLIDQGSGVVGSPAHKFMPMLPDDGRITADYEGNRFGASNIKTYADRVLHAAGRHTQKYPTVARSTLSTEDLTEVGSFDGAVLTIKRAHYPTVAEWIGVPVEDLAEQLEVSHG